MNTSQKIGLILVVAAFQVAAWAVGRYTGIAGRLHSWDFPLTSYETYTIVAGLVALMFLVGGLRMLSERPSAAAKQPSATQT